MKIVKGNSPYIHRKSSVKRMMLDVLIALIPVVVFSIIQYGLDAVKILGISIVTMLASELVYVFIVNQDPYDGNKKTFKERIKTAKDKASINNILAPLISAIIYAMIMPAGAKWYYIFIGSFSGMVFGKLLFGGLGANIFNPAALGRIITVVCFGGKMQYTNPLINGTFDAIASGTPLGVIATDATVYNFESIKNLLFGFIPGSIGEICKIAIIIGFIYLIIRKSADFRPTLGMLGSFTVLIVIAAIAKHENVLTFSLYHLLSGGLLFGACFMVTDPITSPVTRPGRFTFGICVGVITALIRLLGAYPEGVAFAILLSNMLVPVIDYYKWSTNKYSYKHAILWGSIMIASGVVIFFAV